MFNFTHIKEYQRKLFHVSSIILPILYSYIPKLWMVPILGLVLLCTVSLDISRHYNVKIQELVNKFFWQIMRDHERSNQIRPSGASCMMAGFFFSCLLFNKGIAISSWMVLIVSDSSAAIFGKHIGIPKNHGKSLEGAIAFFVSAVLITLVVHSFIPYRANFLSIVIASAITSIVEYHEHQIGIDDNLTVPVTFSIVMVCAIWLSA